MLSPLHLLVRALEVQVYKQFPVGIEIKKKDFQKIYYVYQEVNGRKLWITKKKELSSWMKEKAYVTTWEAATELVKQIFAGEIK